MRWLVHKGMRKPDFGPVHSAVAGALEHGKHIVVARVERDALGSGLGREKVSNRASPPLDLSGPHGWEDRKWRRTFRPSRARDMVPRLKRRVV